MKLKELYREIVNKGIQEDVRSSKEIAALLAGKKNEFEALRKSRKEFFDQDALFNPFDDSRIIWGNPEAKIRSMIVGIDVDGAELLLVDRLKGKGENIDLAVSHHPQGAAYAQFYGVMDLQVNVFSQEGISLSVSENLLNNRKAEVARRVSAANHLRGPDVARLLKINFLCMHTPCDNCAYQYLKRALGKTKPKNLGEIIDLLYVIPEYAQAAKNNNPPEITLGNRKSGCKKIHLEFTGGTEGPKEIYKELASQGVDTIIAMHQSDEHFQKCKEHNINVVIASHIASDNLGVNIMLDHLEKKGKFKVYEFGGFRRFTHKK
ncbi:MAG: NGG1p interacting factor NIF3 [Candidatus Omnitrophica bacterium]|nr:NGG1p interacting factor NIF3 [Candidatus Omnitrophota bacterium]MBU2251188.1 NGG1p interacting factor NIF3 [Candidatus Omnitrophota bacterium]